MNCLKCILIIFLLAAKSAAYSSENDGKTGNEVVVSTAIGKLTPHTSNQYEIEPSTGTDLLQIPPGQAGQVPVLMPDTTGMYKVETSTEALRLSSGSTTHSLLPGATAQYNVEASTGVTQSLPEQVPGLAFGTTEQFRDIPYRVLLSTQAMDSVPEGILSFYFERNESLVKGGGEEKTHILPDKYILPGSVEFNDPQTGEEMDVDCIIDYSMGILNFKELLPETTSFKVIYACFPFKAFTEFIAIDSRFMTADTKKLVPGLGRDLSLRILKKEYVLKGDGGKGPYVLENKLIIPEEETVWTRKRIRNRDMDYYMDYYRGEVNFEEPIADTDTFKVIYKYLPFNIITKGKWKFFVDIAIDSLIEEALPEEKESYNLYEKEEIFMGTDKTGPYLTGEKHVIPGTEVIIMEGRELNKDVDYTIDYLSGRLFFEEPVSAKTAFKMSYRYFPFDISDSYGRKKQFSEGGQSIIKTDSFMKKQKKKDYRLTVGGAQTFEMKFQPGGTTVMNQSLRLDISGNVTEDVRVKMLLSNQSMPIQPEGNTAVIEEMDKIYIEVGYKESMLTLGDYSVAFSGGEFNNYTKKLEGIKGDIVLEPVDITLFTANTGGGYTTVEIKNVTDSQGPYEIVKNRIIMAGTETVWVDDRSSGKGLQKMVRGKENDYTIDYNAATITFSQINRPITSNMIIVVDFEYRDAYYTRSTIGARAKSKNLLDGKMKLGITLLQEKDDEYSNEELYDKEAGKPKDAWVAISTNTIDELRSTSLPPPPIRHSILSLDSSLKLGMFSLTGELAGSSKDNNILYNMPGKTDYERFSSGLAGKLNFSSSFNDMKIGKITLGNLDWRGNLRYEGTEFISLGKSKPVKFTDKWDLAASPATGKPARLNAGTEVTYKPFSFLSFTPNIGVMKEYYVYTDTTTYTSLKDKTNTNISGGFRNIKLSVNKMNKIPGSLNVTGYYDALLKKTTYYRNAGTNNGSGREKWQYEVKYNLWKLTPRISRYHEETTTINQSTAPVSKGAAIQNVFKWGISTREVSWLNLSFGREERDRRTLNVDSDYDVWKSSQNLWLDSNERTDTLKFGFTPGRGTYFRTNLTFNDREANRYSKTGSTTTTTSNLIDMKTNYNPKILKKSLKTMLNYSMKNQFNTQLSTTTTYSTINATLRLNMHPKYLMPGEPGWLVKNILMNWSLENNFSLTEVTANQNDRKRIFLQDRFSEWKLIDLIEFKEREGRDSDVFRRNHILNLLKGNHFINCRLELKESDSNKRFTNELKNIFSNDTSVTLKSNVLKGLSLTGTYKLGSSSTTILNAYDIDKTTNTWVDKQDWIVNAKWQVFKFLAISYNYLEEKDNGNTKAANRTNWQHTGKANISMSSKGRISVTYTKKKETLPAYERITESEKIKIDGNYKVGRNVNSSLSFDFHSPWGKDYKKRRNIMEDFNKDEQKNNDKNILDILLYALEMKFRAEVQIHF